MKLVQRKGLASFFMPSKTIFSYCMQWKLYIVTSFKFSNASLDHCIFFSCVNTGLLILTNAFFFFDLDRVCSDPFTILKTWAWCRWRWSERRGWWQLMLQVRKTLPHTHTVILTYDLSLCFPQLLIKPIISLGTASRRLIVLLSVLC